MSRRKLPPWTPPGPQHQPIEHVRNAVQDQGGTVRFRLCPELSDGQHVSIVDGKAALIEAVSLWADELGDSSGERIWVETVSMTDAEVEALTDL